MKAVGHNGSRQTGTAKNWHNPTRNGHYEIILLRIGFVSCNLILVPWLLSLRGGGGVRGFSEERETFQTKINPACTIEKIII
jgi:hypothetical protein